MRGLGWGDEGGGTRVETVEAGKRDHAIEGTVAE